MKSFFKRFIKNQKGMELISVLALAALATVLAGGIYKNINVTLPDTTVGIGGVVSEIVGELDHKESGSIGCTHTETATINVPGSCVQNSVEGREVCLICGCIIREGIPGERPGHTEEIRYAIEGYTGDTYCSVCNTKLAKGEYIKYIITYNENEGIMPAVYETIYTLISETITLPVPTRVGYTFDGWYTTSDFSDSEVTQIVKGSTGNKTFYAKWNPNTNTPYIIKHYQMNLNGVGYTLKDTDNLTGTTDTQVTPAVKTYTGFTAPATQTVTIAPDGSTVVEYKYTRNKYYLDVNHIIDDNETETPYGTFDIYINGNQMDNDIDNYKVEHYYGTTYEIKDIKSFAGHTYKGEVSYSGTITSNTSVSLEWVRHVYQVKFNTNGGTGTMANQDHTYDVEKALTANTFTRTGYTFTGWNTAADGTGTTYADKAAVKNLTATNGGIFNLYAQWKANNYAYNIVYKSNSGTQLGTDTVTKTFGTTATVNPKAFTGYTSPASQNVVWDATSKTITFTYTPIEYTITCNLNGGTLSTANPAKYTIETNTITLNNPTKTGYTFSGWYESSDFSTAEVTEITKGSTGDKTFYAKWTIVTYTITYNLNGGTQGSGVKTSYNVATSTFSLPTPTRSDYTFEGWYTNSSFTGAAVTQIVKGSTGNKTFYAKWKDNKGLFDANGVQLASWGELVNDYGMDVTVNYTMSTSKTSTTSPYYILNNNDELSTGTTLVLGDGVASIGTYAFFSCGLLTDVTITGSVTSIGDFAFQSCARIVSVTIGDSVTSIGKSVFLQCTNLQSVTIGKNVTSIGDFAFYNCQMLSSVYHKQTTAPTWGSNAFYKSFGTKTTFYFRNSTVASAFTTNYYNSSYGTISTDYSWTAPATLSVRDETTDDNTAYWQTVVNQLLEGETEIALDGTITEMPMDVIDAVSSMDSPVTFSWNDQDFVITQETINDFEYVSGEMVPISELAENYAVEKSNNESKISLFGVLRGFFQ